MSEAIREEAKRIIARQIIIDEVKIDISKKSIEERYENTKHDIDNGEKTSVACKNNSIDIRIYKKLISLNDEEFTNYFKNKYSEKRQSKINRKNEEIKLVKVLYNKGLSLAAISRQTGFDWRTVKKYVNSDNLLTIENTKRERLNLCSPYHDIINKLLINNVKIKNIYLQIQNLGYKGKYRMLKRYISNLSKNGKLTYKKLFLEKIY